MIAALTKLINLKSILSMLVAGVFVFLACTNGLTQEQTYTIILLVFTFFFNYQANKSKD